MPNQFSTSRPTQLVAGFTLIELMVTVAVAAILLAIAVPSFQRTIANTQAAEASNDLVGAMQLARTEAASRGITIAVASSSSGDWADGWSVVVPAAAGSASATPEILRSYDDLPPSFTLTTADPDNRIEFNARGSVVGAVGDTTIQICREASDEATRKVVTVRASGLVTSFRDDSASGPSC